MVKRIAAAIAMCLTAGSAASAATITLDGSLSDWGSVPALYSSSEITKSSNADAAYSSVWVTNDATNLYVAWSTDGANGGSILNSWAHNLYMDTDVNAATGFNSGWMSHGYDVLVQYGLGGGSYSVFGFSGPNQATWGWTFANTMGYSFSGPVAESSIPLAAIGNPAAITMEFNVTGGSLADETWAYAFESGAKTYVVAVPEPATVGLSTLLVSLLAIRRRP